MSQITRNFRNASLGHQRGFGLVELMVALTLGLLVSGAAIAIFASNGKAYAATQSLGRIQENARIAYELMARDLRDAGGVPCSGKIPIASVVTKGAAAGAGNWWAKWGGGMVGYDASTDTNAPSSMLAGTNAIQMIEAVDTPVSVVQHDPSAQTISTNSNTSDLVAQDVALICDYRQASMFEVQSVSAAGVATYAASGMNCGTNLTFTGPGAPCTSTGGIQYNNSATLARVRAARWYVAANLRGGTSLFQDELRPGGIVVQQEIVEGVSGMTVAYLLPTNTTYVNAAAVGGKWANVTAVRVTLTLQSGNGQDRVSTNNGTLTRTISHVIAIRNHTS